MLPVPFGRRFFSLLFATPGIVHQRAGRRYA